MWTGPIPAAKPAAKARAASRPPSSAGRWTGGPAPTPPKVALAGALPAARPPAPMPPKAAQAAALPAPSPPVPPPATLPPKEEEPQEEAVPLPGIAAAGSQALPVASAAAAGGQATARAVQPAAPAVGRGNKMPARPQESLAQREEALWAEVDAVRTAMSKVEADMAEERGSAREAVHP